MAEILDILNAAVSLLVRAVLPAHVRDLASLCPVCFRCVAPTLLTETRSQILSHDSNPLFHRESDSWSGCGTCPASLGHGSVAHPSDLPSLRQRSN
jgi:hypothetical protein